MRRAHQHALRLRECHLGQPTETYADVSKGRAEAQYAAGNLGPRPSENGGPAILHVGGFAARSFVHLDAVLRLQLRRLQMRVEEEIE